MKWWSKLWTQRPRDFFFRATGTAILLAEGAGWLFGGEKPDPSIVIAAIGLLGSPAFLSRRDGK